MLRPTLTAFRITDVGIEKLAASRQSETLKKLVVSECRVTERGMKALLLSPHLHQLRFLSLFGEVTDSALEVLADPTNVYRFTTLTLISNHISDAGVIALAKCPQLVFLRSLRLQSSNVTDEGVRAIADSSYLRNLETLSLRSTRITTVGLRALGNATTFKRLASLDISRTQVKNRGLRALGKTSLLTTIRSLNLSKTKVTDFGVMALAKSVQVVGLESLDLEGTRVSDRGVVALATSPNLKRLLALRLTGCKLTDAGIDALAKSPHLTHLRQLYVDKTRVTLPYQLLQSHDAVAILQYFRESRIGTPLLEVKVPVLGLGAVGKSLLCERLTRHDSSFQQEKPSTVAFEVHSTSLAVGRDGKDHDCTVRLFDFAGQSELHSAHRFFLADQRNVYIVVVSARLSRQENRLDYWLRMVKHCGGGAPVVVVVTHCDDKHGAIRANRSRERILEHLDAARLSDEHELSVQVINEYSNTDGANISSIREALCHAIANLDVVFLVPYAPGFFELRRHLLGVEHAGVSNLPSFQRYWTLANEFARACNMVGQTDRRQQKFWLILFRDLGYVHFVGDRARVIRRADYSLTNYLFHPEWVKAPVYDVLRLEEARHTTGIVPGEKVMGTLRKSNLSDEEMTLVLTLMGECDLLFRVRGGDVTPDYLIPDQLGMRPREMTFGKWPKDPKRHYRWQFRFLPDHLLSQLVGRWFDDQRQGFVYYRDEVILSRHGVIGQVRLVADFNVHTLDVEFDRERSDRLKTKLESELENLLDPEGMLSRPLWKEDDLSNPPESIDDNPASLDSLDNQSAEARREVPSSGPEPTTSDETTLCHSRDFRFVIWYGTRYTFTVNQARSVQALWEAAEKGIEVLTSESILKYKLDEDDRKDEDGREVKERKRPRRLRDIFKEAGKGNHPAWGTMIVPVEKRKGIYKLSRPVPRTARTPAAAADDD
jgi:small GTP-binding protein